MAESFEIRRAERRQSRLRLALTATSNGGKTASALLLARGLVEELIARGVLAGTLEGKIGMVDTERGSGQLYAHLVPFDVIDLARPYSVARYSGAMDALERAGCEVIIIDSISHAWQGEGGVLRLLDRMDTSERFRGFGTEVNPAQDEFVDRLLRSPAHVIVTMRQKTQWVIEQVEKKRRDGSVYQTHAPRRVGTAPVQRPGIEYEFTTMLGLDTDSHFASVLKNRCPVFDAEKWQPRKLSAEDGRALAAWLLEGAPEVKPAIDGTPLERAGATAQAALRAIERAGTLPDLERVFVDGDKAIRAFSGHVEDEALGKLRREVAMGKDLRKKQLGAAPPAEYAEATSPGTTAAARRAAGHFDDMEDDLPW